MKRLPPFLLLALVCAASPAVAAAAATGPAVGPATYAPEGVLGLDLPAIAAALAAGETTSEALVAGYLARIERIDRSGPTLQSVLALNPAAREEARASDARRAAGAALGPLDGIPILLKDNIESADAMATTAGALALEDNVTGRDSPLVAGLRGQGAIILGKTNLSQWANFRSTDSISGWSALGGQVRNPHMLDRSPCGSSSGSAVAVAASLAAAAVGTETNGSISCPATVNGVVGFKPTVGLVSQRHIVPISSSQDTAGPMTKTVAGAALLLAAMATGDAGTDYVAALDPGALEGARLGVARFAQGENPDIIALFDRALADLAAAGAVLVEIPEHEAPDGFWANARKVTRYEFKATLDDYLAHAAPAVGTRDLAAVIAFNEAHADVELALFGQDIFADSAALGGLETDEYRAARDAVQKATRADGLDRLLAEHGVLAIVSPSGPLAPPVDPINGDVWPEWAGAGWMAAIAGYPHLTVPMGTVDGLPIGLSFIGGKDRDAQVLALGHAYERKTDRRVEPRYLPGAEARPDIAAAMRPRAGSPSGRAAEKDGTGGDVLAAAAIVAAFGRHDPEAYFALFDPAATFVFHTTLQRLEDRAAYRREWAGWESDLGFRVRSCTSSDPRVQLLGDTAVFTHSVRTVLTTHEGESTLDERETIVFQRRDGRWIAVHEHLSPHPGP